MISETTSAFYIFAGTTAAVAVAFSFPALTSGGNGAVPGVSEAALTEAVSSEMSFCRQSRVPANCVCFAKTSGMILAYNSTPQRSPAYMDQTSLARSQALSRC